MKIICLGDSLTAGMNPTAESHWINILHREAKNEYINKGICGDTTGGMLSRFYRDVVEEHPTCVILMGGGNDFIVGGSPADVQMNIMAMVHQAFYYKIMPIIGVPVCFLPDSIRADWVDFTDFYAVAEKYRVYREWIYRFAKTFHADVLDFQGAFEKNVHGDWNDYFSDGVHPNEKGNRIMADLIIHAGM